MFGIVYVDGRVHIADTCTAQVRSPAGSSSRGFSRSCEDGGVPESPVKRCRLPDGISDSAE